MVLNPGPHGLHHRPQLWWQRVCANHGETKHHATALRPVEAGQEEWHPWPAPGMMELRDHKVRQQRLRRSRSARVPASVVCRTGKVWAVLRAERGQVQAKGRKHCEQQRVHHPCHATTARTAVARVGAEPNTATERTRRDARARARQRYIGALVCGDGPTAGLAHGAMRPCAGVGQTRIKTSRSRKTPPALKLVFTGTGSARQAGGGRRAAGLHRGRKV